MTRQAWTQITFVPKTCIARDQTEHHNLHVAFHQAETTKGQLDTCNLTANKEKKNRLTVKSLSSGKAVPNERWLQEKDGRPTATKLIRNDSSKVHGQEKVQDNVHRNHDECSPNRKRRSCRVQVAEGQARSRVQEYNLPERTAGSKHTV